MAKKKHLRTTLTQHNTQTHVTLDNQINITNIEHTKEQLIPPSKMNVIMTL